MILDGSHDLKTHPTLALQVMLRDVIKAARDKELGKGDGLFSRPLMQVKKSRGKESKVFTGDKDCGTITLEAIRAPKATSK